MKILVVLALQIIGGALLIAASEVAFGTAPALAAAGLFLFVGGLAYERGW